MVMRSKIKTLLILRHGKSSWKLPELADHDRPLNKRGKRDAPKIGNLLKEKDLVPELIISSNAVRADKTAKIVAKASKYKGKVTLLDSLYAAGPDATVNPFGFLITCSRKIYISKALHRSRPFQTSYGLL
jgi:phosphohistidine phosphatase